MSPDYPRHLSQELLDDFYAESAELVQAVTTWLIEAQTEAADEPTRMHALQEGYASTHTLKGIAGIAGVQPAEALAHRMEDVLRRITQRTLDPTRSRIDLLLNATRRVEAVIAAHRAGQPAPSIDAWLEKLRQDLEGASSAPAPTPPPPAATTGDDPVRRSRQRGLHPWRCTFHPTVERDARGINVASVRERLQAHGEIMHAEPVFRGGAMSFTFVVGRTLGGLEAPPEWQVDGLMCEPAPETAGMAAGAGAAMEVRAPDGPTLAPSHIVRVDLGRLDELMRITGDVLIQRSRLEQRIREHHADDELLQEIDLKLARSFRDLRRAITRVRLVPLAEVFSRLPFAVRDLADETGKRVHVQVQDHRAEIDKFLAERLREPLLHLVRNACTHGIETPAEREAAGKPAEATLRLQAVSQGDFVDVSVADDGRGIDSKTVVARAAALGLPVPEVVDAPALLTILCASGFSTREEADRAAGRGIGMAIVASTVRELGGTLSLRTTPGQGTTFLLRLPLTLSISDVLIVRVAEEICGVPQPAIDEIVQVAADQVRRIKQTDTVPYRDGLLPLVWLRRLFQLELPAAAQLTLVVVRSDHGAVGLVVDRVQARREVVVRPLSDPLVRVPGFSGATELGNGRPILILDPASLARGAVRPVPAASSAVSASR